MSGKVGMYIGIGVSVVIVVVIAIFLFGRGGAGNPIGDPDLTANPAMLKKLELNIDFSRLVSPPPAGAEGAEALYSDAATLAKDYGALFIEGMKNAKFDPRDDDKMKPILDKLLAAADKGLGSAKLKFDGLPEISVYTEWGNCDSLKRCSEILSYDALARQMKDKDEAGAAKSVRAGLIYAERVYKNSEDFVAYRQAGAYCLSLSIGTAQTIWKDDAAKKAIADEIYQTFRKTGDPVAAKVQMILKDPSKINCADLWNMAENDEDKAYKIEALMWLGVARWTPTGTPKRSAIENYLTKKAASSDPLIAKYAAEGKKFPKGDVAPLGNVLPH